MPNPEFQAEYAEKKQQAAEISALITRNYWTEPETGPRMVKSFSGAMAIENFVIEEKKADKAVEYDAASETRRKQIEEEEIQAKKERKVGFTRRFRLNRFWPRYRSCTSFLWYLVLRFLDKYLGCHC